MPKREIHQSFRFRVTIAGNEDANFQTCSSLEANLNVASYREAGSILVIKDPVDVEYGPVTLTRGVASSGFLLDWFLQTARATGGSEAGLPVANVYKRQVFLYQDNIFGQTLRKYTLFGAFPTQFTAGAWSALEDAVTIESLTLAYDFYTVDIKVIPEVKPTQTR